MKTEEMIERPETPQTIEAMLPDLVEGIGKSIERSGGFIATEMEKHTEAICATIHNSLFSGNEFDSNGEVPNVVDGLFAIARGLNDIAQALRDRKERNESGN